MTREKKNSIALSPRPEIRTLSRSLFPSPIPNPREPPPRILGTALPPCAPPGLSLASAAAAASRISAPPATSRASTPAVASPRVRAIASWDPRCRWPSPRRRILGFVAACRWSPTCGREVLLCTLSVSDLVF